MKQLGILFALFAGLAIAVGLAFAQSTPLSFTCIAAEVGATTCPDGSTPLSAYVPPPPSANPPTYVTVAGYFQQSDAGGGEFYRLGSAATNCYSNNSTNYATGNGTVGKAEITGISGVENLKWLQVGELVTGSGTDSSDGTVQLQPGTEIASIDTHKGNIVLTLPLTGTSTQNVQMNNIVLTGDNTGTLIVDAGGECWQKTDYRGDPHEFGAYGDGNSTSPHDDTVALQNWLGAYGNVNPTLAPGTAPTNFGPWIATIPATYEVSQPLVCPPYADLQAGANIAAGAPNNGGGSSSPIVKIVAVAPNSNTNIPAFGDTLGLSALMMASPYCRISGIALDANGNGNYIFPGLPGSVNNTTVTLNANAPAGVVPGMPLYDSGSCIAKGAAVTAVNGAILTMSVAASSGCGSGDSITITGFYGVDVVGTHAGIDNHSLVENGFHNVHCGDTQLDGLQLKDAQFLKSYDTGVYLTGNCNDVRVIGDIVAESGQGLKNPGAVGITGAGIVFSGPDFSLEGGIVEQSQGPNIIITHASLVTVNGMVVDGSDSDAGTGIEVDNSTHVSICGNRFQRSGGPGAGSSHVLLSGTLDDVVFCGNSYSIGSYGSDANVYPWYDFDVSSPLPALTNVHIYDTPEQPAVAVLSPAAQPLLQQLFVPQFTQNQIGGLTLSNDANSQTIDIAAGAAVDSTGSALITLPPPPGGGPACTVNLAAPSNGPRGLDAGNVQPNTTYFIYLIAAVGGNSAQSPSCMASNSLVPIFKKDAFAGTGYMVTATAGTQGTAPAVLLNVNPLSGVAVGDAILSDDGNIPSGTTITGFSANQMASGVTGAWNVGSNTITVNSTAGVYPGMAVQDTANGCLKNGTYITAVISPGQLTIQPATICSEPNSVSLSISGASQLVLSAPAAKTTLETAIRISTGYYRLLGAIYTDATSDVVKFTQDGDTFYLAQPAPVASVAVGNTPVTVTLPSAPNGISVKAFGRCVGGSATGTHHVIIYSPGQTAMPAAQAFPYPPGYDVDSLTPSTAFSFNAWTDTAQSLRAIADSGTPGVTIQCMNDGWVWNPALAPSAGAGLAARRGRTTPTRRNPLHP